MNELLILIFLIVEFEFSPELIDLSPTELVTIFSKTTSDPDKSIASFKILLKLEPLITPSPKSISIASDWILS